MCELNGGFQHALLPNFSFICALLISFKSTQCPPFCSRSLRIALRTVLVHGSKLIHKGLYLARIEVYCNWIV
ncbi:hypothetical protein L1887_21488 [Cichorium endivia]|nr:hypothetical protein L1887_21488 [Cichorium endivia]